MIHVSVTRWAALAVAAAFLVAGPVAAASSKPRPSAPPVWQPRDTRSGQSHDKPSGLLSLLISKHHKGNHPPKCRRR